MEVPARGNLFGRWLPARYVFAVLGSIGMGITYGLKVNLSVALVGMLNYTAIAELQPNHVYADECPSDEPKGAEPAISGPFVWKARTQGLILSCYFWGYLLSQFPGGRLAETVSAKWVMFFSVVLNVVCTLLTPVAANAHYGVVVLMRLCEGIAGGVTFPAMNVLLSRWAPKNERGVMASIVFAGTALGTVISVLVAGFLINHSGWESVFYVMGGLSAVWCVLWVFLVYDSPLDTALISLEEREMIVASVGAETEQEHKKLPIPWKSVFTSLPFHAILVSHTCSNWGWYTLLIELPFYMKDILKFRFTQNTITTSLPFLTLWIFSLVLSETLDKLGEKGKLTLTQARKISTLFASVIPAICLIALSYIGCNKGAAAALLVIAVTSIGGMFCGFLANHIDLAPNFAGTLMAITNSVATLPGIVVPVFVGYVTEDNHTIAAWRIIFLVTAALYVVEIVVYTLFGSGEEQPWNHQPAQ